MALLAAQRGIPVFRASLKQVERGRFKLLAGMVPVGSVAFVAHALRQLGQHLPEHTPYPSALNHLLHRKVRRLRSLREAKALLAEKRQLFIKPADGFKRFTGFVAEFPDDPRFNRAAGSKPVWVSDPVRFVSEWRAYVADDKILDIRFVDDGGNRDVTANLGLIQDAVNALAASATAPAGYVIDFGVLDTGETALIEMNEGFAFGAYDGVSAEVYWAVTISRWQELTGAL